MIRPPPRSTLFPHPTLFRSQVGLYEWVKGGKPISEFREMDFNDDGFLTAEEVLRFVHVGKPPLVNMASNTGDSVGSMLLNSADRKSTRLNSSHSQISYAVFC